MKNKQLPRISKNQWLIISVATFLVGTVIFSGRDYLIHHDLYGWGLQADMSWILKDWLIYFFELQAVAVACVLIARSHRLSLLIFFEAFILSSTQDLIFFGLWGYGSFPSESWTWMYNYQFFGVWTTPMQLAYSGFALLFGGLAAYYLPKKMFGVKVP